jgi:hypothetical protein
VKQWTSFFCFLCLLCYSSSSLFHQTNKEMTMEEVSLAGTLPFDRAVEQVSFYFILFYCIPIFHTNFLFLLHLFSWNILKIMVFLIIFFFSIFCTLFPKFHIFLTVFLWLCCSLYNWRKFSCAMCINYLMWVQNFEGNTWARKHGHSSD